MNEIDYPCDELGLGYFHEVVNFLDHAHYGGGVLFNDSVIHFFQAERVESALLHCGAVDAAFDLSDFDLCHFSNMLAVKHFFYRDTTVLGNLRGRAHFVESCDCSLHEVVGV